MRYSRYIMIVAGALAGILFVLARILVVSSKAVTLNGDPETGFVLQMPDILTLAGQIGLALVLGGMVGWVLWYGFYWLTNRGTKRNG